MVVDFVSVRVCLCSCMCVSRPLWSPLIPNLTDVMQRHLVLCAEFLSGILDAASITLTSPPPVRNTPFDAWIVHQDRWLLNLFTIQVCFQQFSDL